MAHYQNGELIEVTTGDAAHGGWCVARPDDGPVVFVRHALPGEVVRAKVTEVTSRFARADAVEILKASPDRVTPPCPYARPGACGGCDWQHATLPAQRALKAAVVSQQLRRLAGIDRDVIVEPLPDPEPDTGEGLGWRTRMGFAVRADGVAGLRAHRSHRVVDVADCLIAGRAIRDLDIPGSGWKGLTGVEVQTGSADDDRTVILEGKPREPGRSVAAASVFTRAGRRLTPVRGRPYLTQHAAGRQWRVSVGAFWQVHPLAADALAEAVVAALRPRAGDVVADLYCGAGLFAGVLAPAVGPEGTVIGVESDAAAVRDARHNLRDHGWARVHRGDVADVLRQGKLPPAALVVADPPRSGLAREVISYVTQSAAATEGAARFAYVSCDPATLARDTGLLIAAGWTLASLRAFDAFPMTHHVECVAAFTR